MKRVLMFVGISVFVSAAACAGGSGDDGSVPADEQDIKVATTCFPIVTLTCAQGFESTEQGCAQSQVSPNRAPKPLGRCISVDVAKLTGTFVSPQGAEDALPFFSVTFRGDGSYDTSGGCRSDGSGPSCQAIIRTSGTWSITKSGGASQVVLVDDVRQKQALFYTIDGAKLSLRESASGKSSLFLKQ